MTSTLLPFFRRSVYFGSKRSICLGGRGQFRLAKGGYFKPDFPPNQRFRAEVLFKHYPQLEDAYKLTMGLRHIYHTTEDRNLAFTRLAHWFKKVEDTGFGQFKIVERTIVNHYRTILNFFTNQSTNASGESFNAKIKSFRATLRGVKNIPYFLFRLANIYA